MTSKRRFHPPRLQTTDSSR